MPNLKQHMPSSEQLLREREALLRKENAMLLAALRRSEQYVAQAYSKLLNTAAGLSDQAFERYIKEPAYKRIKADRDAVERALKRCTPKGKKQ